MAGAARRRADIALEQAERNRDEAEALVRDLVAAMADEVIDEEEEANLMQRARALSVGAEKTQVLIEWVGTGELEAVAKLTGRGSKNAAVRDIDVQRRAANIGLVLSTP